jgi:nucleotide-binding universal stress UspA family protein
VAYNNTSESERALAAARMLAARHGAALHAMTVIRPPGGLIGVAGSRWTKTMDRVEDAALDRLHALGDVVGRVTIGPADLELGVFGDEVDLLVLGSRGHGSLRRLLLGSTSAHLARSARCPVLVLPAGCRPPPDHDGA